MSMSLLVCMAVSVAIAIVVIFMAVGALNLSLPFGQAIPMAIAAVIGVVAGSAIHKRFVVNR